jgi:hypothetical protein
MPIYHSLEELEANEFTKFIIIPRKDIVATLRPEHIQFSNQFEDKVDMGEKAFTINHLDKDHKVFISTEEKFIPDTLDERGNIVYKLNNYNVMPTDNCYIQLIGSQNIRNSFVLITSSGVWTASEKETYLSAGVPPRLQPPVFWNKDLRKVKTEATKAKKLYKYMNNKREMIEDTKFVSYFLNPLSPTYLNVMGSGQSAYGLAGAVKLNAKQIMDVVSTSRVHNIILRELGVFMPELAKAVKAKNNPETVATMLNDIANQAIKSDTVSVDDKLKSVQAIVNTGYPEEMVDLTNKEPSALPAGAYSTPLVSAQPKVEALPVYDDTDVKENTDAQPPPDKASIKKMKEEAGVMDDYIIDGDQPRPQPSDTQ